MTAPPVSDQITARDACTLADQIANRTLSVEQVASAHLDQIEAHNGAVNAIVSLRPRDEILAEARRMDQDGITGPLAGLPMAIKDLTDVAGITSTSGSPIYRDHIPTSDGYHAARIRAAGALIIGKTNVPELGLGSHSYNPVHGVTRTPYNLNRAAGGSSGGAGSALAARMVPIADGSDAMGSLRNPAGWNNVYGFRPTHGLVPAAPAGETFLHPISTAGPMARSPRDLALLLGVMAAPDVRNPWSHPPFAGIAPLKPSLKIGWIGDWSGYYPMEDGVCALCESALNVLSDLGCEVVDFTPTMRPQDLWKSWITLRSWANVADLGTLADDPATRDLLKPEALWEVEYGRALSLADIDAASVVRCDWFRACATRPDVDVFALPSAQMFAFDASIDWPKQVAGRTMDTYHRWMEVVIPASLAGLPTLCVPAGFSAPGPAKGLPMGLQLIGKPGQDAALLGLGDAYHQATLWPQRHAPF